MLLEDVIERIDAFEQTMREFLETLRDSTPEDDRVMTSWTRCSDAFRDMGDPDRLLDGLEGEEKARVEDRVDDLVRLNAVLASAVRRERDHVVQALDHTQGGRRALAGYGSHGETGEICDLSG